MYRFKANVRSSIGFACAATLLACVAASQPATAQYIITEIIDATGDGAGNVLDNSSGVAVGADGDGIRDCLLPPPPAGQTGGCCAPGVFPMLGLFTPAVLTGWRLRRRSVR